MAETGSEAPIVPDAKPLPDPPTDGISKLSFFPSSSKQSLLASTSWDGALRLHDIGEKACKLSHAASIGPLLSLAAVDEEYVFVGGLAGTILRFNVSVIAGGAPVVEKVGQHPTTSPQSPASGACSCLVTIPSSPPLLASAGWHKELHLWDLRTSENRAAVTVSLPGKAFSMDMYENRIVVGCSGRQTCLFDIRREGTSWATDSVMEAESSQKHQTRCVKFFPNGQSIAVGSVEGRVAVESVAPGDTDGSTMKKIYAFKCHRDGDLVYPVNCIEFHPKYGTFATGGCDGGVTTWDGAARKRLTSFKFPTSVAALAYNHDGTTMAVASSYTFEEGDREHARDEIYIRPMLDSECAPKQSSS